MKNLPMISAAAALLLAGSAMAQNALIDYQGYAWETGGIPTSDAGDTLSIVGVVDSLDSRFLIDVQSTEVTLYASGLISTGQVDLGGGFLAISYSGGTLELWQDGSNDHDYGTNPPNPTAPPTFVNGSLFLAGALSSFALYLDTGTGSGAYEGTCTFTSGSGLATLNQISAGGYTFGGVLDVAASGGNVPLGYDLQVDGVIEVEVIIAVEPKTWGSVKEMYRR